MPQHRMGDMLRERREQLGYSLDQAARTTNIRARVLAIFEDGDYPSFPPPGYARGMLSSYARFLEMDPRSVLDAYEEEFAAYDERSQIETAASRVRKGQGRFGERRESSARPLSRQSAHTGASAGAQGSSAIEQEQVARHDDRYKSGSVRVVSTRRAGRAGARRRTAGGDVPARASRPRADAPTVQAAAPSRSARPADSRSARGRRGSDGSVGDRITRTPQVSSVRSDDDSLGDDYSLRHDDDTGRRGSRRSRRASAARRRRDEAAEENRGPLGRVAAAVRSIFQETRTRLIAIAAILIVIAVLVAANILISTAGNANSGLIAVQGGAEDTTTTSTDSKNASATITTTNGNPISVQMDVAENQTCLVNVTYDDNNAFNGTAVGPWHREFQVTESLSATFSNPDAVSVTGNGNPLGIEKGSDGSGSLTLQIETTSTADDGAGSR